MIIKQKIKPDSEFIKAYREAVKGQSSEFVAKVVSGILQELNKDYWASTMGKFELARINKRKAAR